MLRTSQGRGAYAQAMYTSRSDSRGRTQCGRLRRVSQNWLRMGPSTDLSDLRPCWLLRFVAPQACDSTFSHDPTPDYAIDRARRRLGLVLRRRNLRALSESREFSVSLGGFHPTLRLNKPSRYFHYTIRTCCLVRLVSLRGQT